MVYYGFTRKYMMKKYFAYLFLASSMAGAQNYFYFTTGQAARAVFGQQTFTAQDEDTGTAGGECSTTAGTLQVCNPTPYILGASGGVAYANGNLFIADSNYMGAAPLYERVLIYTSIGEALPSPTADISLPSTPFVRCPVCIGSTLTPLNVYTLGGYPAAASLPTGTAVPNFTYYGTTSQSFRTPTAVATNGTILVVADTDNNRILIWNSIPNNNGVAADIVLGQPDMNTVKPVTVDNKSFRGPEGVWIQGSQLFVADTQNNRVMIYNQIPTSNDAAADVVLGVKDFTTAPPLDVTTNPPKPSASNMLSPTSVTSDGTRLFVSDLGQNRILIWNSIPNSNGQPADVEIGQPDMTGNVSNNAFTGTSATSSTDTTNKETPVLCTVPSGTDLASNNVYPFRCAFTMSYPRFALSDGTRLFVADAGNDRVLVYDQIPTQNAQRADIILGQANETDDVVTDSTDAFRPDANVGRSAADEIRSPTSLAWDGTNLYVADPYDRRIMVFTAALPLIPLNGIVNSASINVNAAGTVDLSGTITAGDTVTISIGTNSNTTAIAYTYTVQATDTLQTIVQALVNLINTQNGGDPNVLAVANTAIDEVVLTSKLVGNNGNAITLAGSSAGAGSTTANPKTATEVLTASGSTLSGGGTAGEIAPGTLVTIFATPGLQLSDQTASADPNASLPTTLGGVQVYFDGLKIPLSYVSPKQINAQMPYEVLDVSSVSAYVRIQHSDGSITVSSAVGIPIVGENPGIYAYGGTEPRQVMAYHASSYALAVVDLEGTTEAGDTATISVGTHSYNYNVQATDTLDSVRDALVALVNSNPNEKVTATAAGQYDRVILTAKVPGPDGNGIPIGGSASSTLTAGATITVTALQIQTGGASVAGAPVTMDNPAVPGELITIYATGLGVIGPAGAQNYENDGAPYPIDGPPNAPTAPVDNAQIGGKTASVLFSGLKQGLIGVYEVQLLLDVGLPTNLQTQMFIAQNVFTSNICTIPVVAATPPVTQ